MIIRTSPAAQVSLANLSKFVEERNTPGSGDRYVEKFLANAQKYALKGVTYKKCIDERLGALNYSCINFNNWVIAFKIEDENFNIYEIIWGPILK